MGKKRETKFTPRARGNAPASKSSKITHSAPSKATTKRKQNTVLTRSEETTKKRETRANGKPATDSLRSVRTISVRQQPKKSTDKETLVTVTQDLFRGAKSIEITKNSISVTHASSKAVKGLFEKMERRRYVPKTEETVAEVKAALYADSAKVKKVRVEFK